MIGASYVMVLYLVMFI